MVSTAGRRYGRITERPVTLQEITMTLSRPPIATPGLRRSKAARCTTRPSRSTTRASPSTSRPCSIAARSSSSSATDRSEPASSPSSVRAGRIERGGDERRDRGRERQPDQRRLVRGHPRGDRGSISGRRVERARHPGPEWRRPGGHPVELRDFDDGRGGGAADDQAGDPGSGGRLHAARRRRRLRLALRPGGPLLDVFAGCHQRELPARRPGRGRRRGRDVHQRLPRLLLGPLAAHPLRGLPEPRRRRPTRRTRSRRRRSPCPRPRAPRSTRPTATARASPT